MNEINECASRHDTIGVLQGCLRQGEYHLGKLLGVAMPHTDSRTYELLAAIEAQIPAVSDERPGRSDDHRPDDSGRQMEDPV